MKNGFKYLGVHLGVRLEVMKNWEGVVEKIEGRLKKMALAFASDVL